MVADEKKEILSSEYLTIMIYMILNEVIVPFLRFDKLGFYNSAIQIYSRRKIDNNNVISRFWNKCKNKNVTNILAKDDIVNQIGNKMLIKEIDSQ